MSENISATIDGKRKFEINERQLFGLRVPLEMSVDGHRLPVKLVGIPQAELDALFSVLLEAENLRLALREHAAAALGWEGVKSRFEQFERTLNSVLLRTDK